MRINSKKPRNLNFLIILSRMALVVLAASGCAYSNTEGRDSNFHTEGEENGFHTEEGDSELYNDGKIIYQWVSKDQIYPLSKSLILMDGNGNNIRFLGVYFTGSPSISPDGTSIAIGCEPGAIEPYDVTEICILDIETRLDEVRHYPHTMYDEPQAIRTRLTLPEQCWGYQYDYKSATYSGVLSIDWSPEADKLVVVCGDRNTSEVCILPLAGEASCWDESAAEGVSRVVWSPTDKNTLATSGAHTRFSEIYLVNPSGENKRFLATGWSPEWSPDGSRIAYIEKIPGADYPWDGIAIMDLDGSGLEWVYQPEPDVPERVIAIEQNGVFDQDETIRLAWSPDGKYIAFTANYMGVSHLFRLDIETKEIIIMIDPAIFDHWVTETDWGK